MGKFVSVVGKDGKGEKEGVVTMVPYLPENPTEDQKAAYEAAFLEPVCEKALGEGILPNPEQPGEYFKKGDFAGWEALKTKLNHKYRQRMREDAKKRKPF